MQSGLYILQEIAQKRGICQYDKMKLLAWHLLQLFFEHPEYWHTICIGIQLTNGNKEIFEIEDCY